MCVREGEGLATLRCVFLVHRQRLRNLEALLEQVTGRAVSCLHDCLGALGLQPSALNWQV